MISIKEFIMLLKLVWMKNVILRNVIVSFRFRCKENCFIQERIYKEKIEIKCKKKIYFGRMFQMYGYFFFDYYQKYINSYKRID